jgi:hypothetical protein
LRTCELNPGSTPEQIRAGLKLLAEKNIIRQVETYRQNGEDKHYETLE